MVAEGIPHDPAPVGGGPAPDATLLHITTGGGLPSPSPRQTRALSRRLHQLPKRLHAHVSIGCNVLVPLYYCHMRHHNSPPFSSGPWQVVEEQSNLTWWRYTVSYECGTRCEGRLQLDHTQIPRDPSAGREHRVLVRDERCSRVPLLPWPRICEDTHTETSVSPRAGGGAKLAELSVSRCGLLGALTRACGALDRDEVLRNWKRTLAEVSLQQWSLMCNVFVNLKVIRLIVVTESIHLFINICIFIKH